MRKAWLLAPLVAAAAVLSGAGCNSKDAEKARIESYRSEHNVEALAKEAASPKPETSQAAVQALGTLGPAAIPRIQESLKDTRSEVRVAAALAYGQAVQVRGQPIPPPDQIRPLAAAVQSDPSPEVRAAAVTALGHARALDEMPTIFKALEDPDPMVRARASATLARITGRRYETFVDGTPEQRHNAVIAIRQMLSADEKNTRTYYNQKYAAKGAPKATP
ncbi:MAG: HEAT repeat domain-containing protein [Planctomycetota bacterium]|nr:HEAT repeat domain-containing protein [Planctomycetota bacterium]